MTEWLNWTELRAAWNELHTDSHLSSLRTNVVPVFKENRAVSETQAWFQGDETLIHRAGCSQLEHLTQPLASLTSFLLSCPVWWACRGWLISCASVDRLWASLVAQWSRIHLQRRRHGFDPWVWKIPWRRNWQPTPVLLPGRIPWTEEPGGLQSVGSQRVRHDGVTELARRRLWPLE